MKSVYRCALAIAVSVCFLPASLFASSLAFDRASDPTYNGGWTAGMNGGAGWNGGWAMFIGASPSNTPTAQFIGSSTNNDKNGDINADGDIDTTGKSWGLLGNAQDVFGERIFNGPLNVGQTFVISMDNGAVPTNNGAEVGFLLQNDLFETRLQFILTGATNVYNLEHIGATTGITNTDQGMKIAVQVVNVDTAVVSVTTLADGVTHVFSNILMNAGVSNGHHQVTSVVLENKSTGGAATNQTFFNSMYILPDTNDTTFFADQTLSVAASLNPALVNSNLTYTITVTNKGPASATGMTVTDVPPSGVTFVSATSAQGTCRTDAFHNVICDMGPLATNATASISVVVTPTVSGALTNVASVFSLNVDTNLADNVVTTSGSAVSSSQLSVAPAGFDFGPVVTGTTHQTSFVVTNLGGSTLTGTATVSTASFAIASGSPFSIAGFGSTNVGVSFTPSSAGSFTDHVVFVSNGGVSSNLVTGTGAVAPAASFSGLPRAGVAPLLVTFTDTSTGTITNRFWDFGDAGTTNTLNAAVVHTYALTGTDTVTLIVSGPLGVSTNTQLGYITVTNVPAQMSVAPSSHDFGFLAVGQVKTQTFSVINGGSVALTGTVTVTGTSFGLVNGSPFNVGGGQTGQVNVSFSPGSAGSFTGSVAFASNGGNATNAVTGIGAIAPVANFSASPTNGVAPLNVTFTGTSTGTITNQSWTFGDGGTSTSSSPSHTYTNAGSFSVSLTVLGPLGSSTTNRTNLIIATNAPPVASFTASPTNGAVSLNVTFTDTSSGIITNHSWTFGDGGTSTASSPSHSYATTGTFSVVLSVSGPFGSSTTNRANLITVTNGAPPSVSITRPATGMLYPIAFTNETITIVASASDVDGISLIEFFVDAIKLGQTNANPGSILWNGPTAGNHTLTAVAHDTLGATNISAAVTVTIGAKNSPLGDWQVTISGADKGVEFLTFEDDFSASGYAIRLKPFGLDDVSGTWGFGAKGAITGSLVEQIGSTTNWTGTLAGKATSLKSLSTSVTTTNAGVFKWKGVPATTFPDLSGTWTGVVSIAKAPTSVSYAVRTNATDSAVFDVTTTVDTNTVIGQLIATSRDVVYGYVTTGGTNITMSGKFSAKKLSLTFKGTDTTADKVSIQLFQ